MPFRHLTVDEFLELPDWKERLLRAATNPISDPFIITVPAGNPLDDWEDLSTPQVIGGEEEADIFSFMVFIPRERQKESWTYLLKNIEQDTALSWIKHPYFLKWLYTSATQGDREILEAWIDLNHRIDGNLEYLESDLAQKVTNVKRAKKTSSEIDDSIIRDMIDLFPDKINWENVLNKALYIGNRFMKAHKIQEDPFDYILEELVIFVYSRNPSFRPD